MFPFLEGYRSKLESRLKLEKRKFGSLNGPWMKQRLADSIQHFREHFGKTSHAELREFLEQERADIHRILLARRLDEDEIHMLRKKIKDYYYTNRVFEDNNEYFENIDRFQELLGSWHDTVIIRQALEKITRSGQLHDPEKYRVDSLVSEMIKKEEVLYNKILAEKDAMIRSFRMMGS